MNKEVLYKQDKTTSIPIGANIDINVETKSNNKFDFTIFGTGGSSGNIQINFYAVLDDNKLSTIKITTDDSYMAYISEKSIPKGKYRMKLCNKSGSAQTIYYRYQFTQS